MSVAGPEPHHWFEELADHMGSAYLRYSFTKGTDNEVAFLTDSLGLEPGMRMLDVGCGPGRHALAFARQGIEVLGVDISRRFVDLANDQATTEALPATFVRADATDLDAVTAQLPPFDAAISLCQGAIGLAGPGPFEADQSNTHHDGAVLGGMARAVRTGGRVAVSAFSAYFQIRHLSEANQFDAATAVHHETTQVRDPEGRPKDVDLWTTCTTPRELSLLSERAGLTVEDIWSVTPGNYERRPPTIETEEFLLLATRRS